MISFKRAAARFVAAVAILAVVYGPTLAQVSPARHAAGSIAVPSGWLVERIVILMRHGVRSPDRPVPTIAGMPNPFPKWAGEPGGLTVHGAKAIALLGASDRRWMTSLGLLSATGCPEPDAVRILANSYPRTIRTAEVYAANVAPGCKIDPVHLPAGRPDPLFPSAASGTLSFSPVKADEAAKDAIGPEGLAAWDRRSDPLVSRLNKILCGTAADSCGIREPSSLQSATAVRLPRLSGRIATAAEASAALLLQYADGWPMNRVAWGRATASDISALSVLINKPFSITVRPAYLSLLETPLLRHRMAATLEDSEQARVTVIVGHDGTIASLAGQLGLHWAVPGFAPDYPSFGSGLGFAKLRAPDGKAYVTAFYRGQSLDQIRSLATGRNGESYLTPLPLRCRSTALAGACEAGEFRTLLLPVR